MEEPVIALVEAKNTDMKLGLGQCVAEMIGAQRFNQEKGNNIPCIYGATTTGVDWQFLKLTENNLQIDIAIYPIQQSDRILGILSGMVNQSA